MKRVMIVGQPGSGKSTLARQLGRITGLPVIHRDQLLFDADWSEPDNAEKDRRCLAAEAQDAWIFEGGHSRTWPNRVARADTIIWLDLPLVIRTRRVLFRTLKYHGRRRPDLAPGCRERFDPAFYAWIWTTRKVGRNRMAALFEAPLAQKTYLHFRSQAEIDAFVVQCRQGSPAQASFHI